MLTTPSGFGVLFYVFTGIKLVFSRRLAEYLYEASVKVVPQIKRQSSQQPAGFSLSSPSQSVRPLLSPPVSGDFCLHLCFIEMGPWRMCCTVCFLAHSLVSEDGH